MEPTGVTFGDGSDPRNGSETTLQRGRFRVRIVESTGSTNTDLAQAAADGEPGGAVLIARHQTAGRGRLDRRWDAPPGANLLMSVLWRPAPEPAHRATQLVGLAVCRVARRHGVDAAMKWPNDVVVAESKLAGVLAQAVPDGVVVGVGVNVTWAPPGAALLGVELDPVAVGLEVLDELAAAIDAPDEVSTAAYRAALSTLQRRVRVELPGGTTLDGRAIEVESDGHLVVLDACGISHRVDAGDVVHLRPSFPEVESDS